MGGIPAKGAEHQLLGCSPAAQQEVYGPEQNAKGLARAWAGYDQQRAVCVGDHPALLGIQIRVQAEDGGCDFHGSLLDGD